MEDRFRFRTYISDKKFFKFWGWLKRGEYRGLCPSGELGLDELLEKYTNQCTGLKDKNGKLIYEGDIAQRGKDKAIIKWDDEIASFYMKWLGTETYIEDCEIIGNIFENPELLEDYLI